MKSVAEKLVVLAGCACLMSVAQARTCEISVEKGDEAFTVTFAHHANETNGLWAVYGALDRGDGTNGWEHVEFVQTVLPETESVSFAQPEGWGESVKAIRFFLSEVPYDYDYTLDFIRSGSSATDSSSKRRIVLSDFDFNTKYRVGLRMREVKHNGSYNLALFSTRDTQGGGTPYYTLFWIKGTDWRFDYNSVNNDSVAGAKTGTIYDVMADGKNGLYVNGSKISKKTLTYLDKDVTGKLEFFCANQSTASWSNNNGNMDLFGAQVYSSADADAELLVNLVPMVKNGRVGMYDTVRNKYYYNDIGEAEFLLNIGPTRVEAENPFFASALYKVRTVGSEIFAPGVYTEDATSYTNEFGGILDGTSALKLTGANDWGGQFTASNGTLVAQFGQGLAATDNLLLAGGAYGGWDGVATNSFGTGAGEISVPQDKYLMYGAVNGDLRVNIGGESAPWEPTTNFYRLAFGSPVGDGTVIFENPLFLATNANQDAIIRNFTGKSVIAGNVTSDDIWKFSLYGNGYSDNEEVGETVFAGSTNTFATFYQYSGGWTLGSGTTNVINGNTAIPLRHNFSASRDVNRGVLSFL